MSNSQRAIRSYVHNGRVGVLVEFTLESDFAVRTDEFEVLALEVAMQIAATAPESLSTLLAQPFLKDPTRSIAQVLAKLAASLQEHLAITRFVRWDTVVVNSVHPEPPKNPALTLRA